MGLKASLALTKKAEDFEISIKKNDVAIKLPDACKYDLGWFQTKYRVVSDLREYANIKKVQFIEEYMKKVETKEEKKDEKDTKDTKETKESKDIKEDPEQKKETKESEEAKIETENEEETKEEKDV